MLNRRSHRFVFPLGVLVLVATAVVLAAVSNAAPKGKQLHGQMLGIANFFPPSCTSVTGVCSSFTAIGDIKGDGIVNVDTSPIPSGISKAHTVIHTKNGDLTCNEAAVFDVVGPDHAFVDLCVISGGTGIYAGATGYIQEVGTFDFAANLGQLDYYGKLFLADTHGDDD
jgi:hypothetical protein